MPSTRCGSSAAFLSSGCWTIPWRSTLLKSSVVARKTAGPRGAVDGAGDDPALELRDEDDAGVLEAPLLALDPVGRGEQRLRVDRPAVDPVARPGDREVRETGQVLDAGEKHGRAVELRCGGVERGVDRIRPVLRCQDRIGRVAIEELSFVHAVAVSRVRWTAGSPAASSSSAAPCTASVDSAPWLSLVVSSPSPSLQPPVAKS